MNTALKADFVSVEDYLEGEELSDVRHEYVAGVVFAMAGATRAHNLISGNLFAALHAHLRGGRCRVFMADMKVRVLVSNEDFFYYPDLTVTCDPRDTEKLYNSFPKIIVEILSDSTGRIDRIEKFDHYKAIESLDEYVLISQDKREVIVFPRATNWKPEIFDANETLRLPSIDFQIPISEIYREVAI